MSNIAIQVEDLSKLYRIGAVQEKYRTLRDTLSSAALAPARMIRSAFHSHSNGRAARNQPVWALKDVTFEVESGEVVGIIGRNGAGKSTLLKVLSRITEPTSGRAVIHGRVGSLLEVGTGFHPELSGRENILLNGAILGMRRSEIESRFDEIVDFAEVEKYIDTPVKHFSSGMYLRLAFAVAAYLEPEILLVDEVLAVGDAQFQKKCLGKMGEVARQGRTVLFVSHNMAAVQALCNRGIFLSNGTVCYDDTAQNAISTYLRTMDQNAEQDLTARADRQGRGAIQLTKIEISTGGDYPSATLATGRSAEFVFHVTKAEPSLACVFTVYDYLGQAVLNFNSAIHSPADRSEPQIGAKFVCQIDELLLVPGQYRINVALQNGKQREDHLEAAATFDVVDGSVRGRPIARSSGYGLVHHLHRWITPVA